MVVELGLLRPHQYLPQHYSGRECRHGWQVHGSLLESFGLILVRPPHLRILLVSESPSLVLVEVLAVGIVRADIPFLVLSATVIVKLARSLIVDGVAGRILPASSLPPQ